MKIPRTSAATLTEPYQVRELPFEGFHATCEQCGKNMGEETGDKCEKCREKESEEND